MTAKINISDSPGEVAKAFARELFLRVSYSSAEFHLALSGGSTPGVLFDLLAEAYHTEMPWNKVHFWWGDERCVPPTDNESNYKMAVDHLFSKVPVRPEQIHRIEGELDPEEAALRYSAEITQNLRQRNHLPVFDMIILGMGDDGHTASIFPGHIQSLSGGRICGVASHPLSGQKRVTLSLAVLNNADHVAFLVTGQSKSAPLAQVILNGETAAELPARHVSPYTGKLAFYLDKPAASLIC